MRKVVATENRAPYPGVFFNPGCLRPYRTDRPLYIYFPGREMDGPVGSASDFERDVKSGEVSFDIRIRKEVLKTDEETGRTLVHTELGEPNDDYFDMFELSLVGKDVISHVENDVQIVEEAAIYAIYIMPIAAIPRSMAEGLPKSSHETQGS